MNERVRREANRLKTSAYYTSIREGIEQKKREEWRPYLEQYMRDTITPYLRDVSINKLIQENVNRTVTITCHICGVVTPIPLTPEVLTDLIKGVTSKIRCTNPQCKGLFIPTTFPFSLSTLITVLTEPPRMPNA